VPEPLTDELVARKKEKEREKKVGAPERLAYPILTLPPPTHHQQLRS